MPMIRVNPRQWAGRQRLNVVDTVGAQVSILKRVEHIPPL